MDESQTELTVNKESFHRRNGPGLSWLLIIIVMILLALAVSLLNSVEPSSNPSPTQVVESPVESHQPRIYTVSYSGGVFSPTNLRIHAGDTVRFKNENIFGVHIVSEDIAGFDSISDIPQSSNFSFTFAAKGTFGYHNYKNSKEVGTIIVR